MVKQKLAKWIRLWFGAHETSESPKPKPTSTTESKPLIDADYEYFFMQLLEGVEHGWRQEQVLRVFDALAERTTVEQWIEWLHNFGDKLLSSATPNTQLATRMVHLGNVGCGEFGEIAKQIGTKLLAKTPELQENDLEMNAGDPQEAQALFYQGLQQFNIEDFSGAIASYDKALAILPEAHEVWYNRANALLRLGSILDAIASYDKAVQYKPDKYEAWNNRGNAFFKLGRMEDAIPSYLKALEFEPNYQQAWYNLGVALGNVGRLEESLGAYDQAVGMEAKDHQAWFNRGLVLGNLGRLEEAIASWDKALEIKPDRYEAWYNRSVALSNLGRNEEAIDSWNKAQAFKAKQGSNDEK